MAELARVVITGMGVVSPIGNNLESFWNNLVAGNSGGGAITKFDASNFATKIACELNEFSIENYAVKYELTSHVVMRPSNFASTKSLLSACSLKSNK